MSSRPGHVRITCKKWFWNVYDHLGTLILVNVLWVVCALLLLTLPASMAGLFRVSNRIAAYEEVSVRDFLIGARRSFWTSWRLCGVYAAVLTILAVNVAFYSRLTESWQWIGMALSGMMLWIAVFIGLTGVYAFPLLSKTGESIRTVCKKSVLITLDNIRYTGIIFMIGLAVLSMGVVTVAGLLFGAVSGVAVLYSTGLREIQKKYDPQATQAPYPDPEEPRGWRDLFRPWDYGK